ncbi:hypothetical protein HRbin15_01834 [bacterium HR15]|nr:hypothetical protein HRbin15_01834 [bacterium HR15]
MDRLERLREQLHPRSLARTWFLIRRRLGQRWVDPWWLQSLQRRLSQPEGLEAHLCPDIASTPLAEVVTRLAHKAGQAFFFGASDLSMLALRYPAEFPEATEQILHEADDLLQGRVHYAETIIETELPFKWYATSTAPGMEKWHRIPAAFHWLKTLMQAFWLSQEERYARTATMLLENWLSTSHSFGHDIWRSTNFVGLRALNLLQGLIGFASYWQRYPELLRPLFVQLYLHLRLLERRIEYWGYNHLLWNAHDLTLLGTALQETFMDATRWARRGTEMMNREVMRQFAPDGIHVERSIHYQVFVSKLLGEWIAVLWKAGQPVPPEVVWRWNQSVEVLRRLRHADGSLPLYGDGYRTHDPNTEGRLEAIADFLFALHAYLHGFQEAARHPLLPWKIGRDFWTDCPQPHSQMQGTKTGIASARVWNEKQQLVLCLQAGNSLSGQVHAHADSLSFTLSDEAGDLLIDPGGYGEVADKWRTYFRSTYAHNTVVVDGHSMSQVQGVYTLYPALRASLDGCWHWREWSAWVAHHRNYQRLRARVLHWRTLLIGGTELLVVLDYLKGKRPFRVEQMFHFAGGRLEQVTESSWLWGDGNRQWRLWFACAAPASVQVFQGSETPLRGWSGEIRGQPRPIPTLVYQSHSSGQHHWIVAALARPHLTITLDLQPASGRSNNPLLRVPGGIVKMIRENPTALRIEWILAHACTPTLRHCMAEAAVE